jgi:hypothetical protein
MQAFKLDENRFLSLIKENPQLAIDELKPLVNRYFRIGQLHWLIGMAYYKTSNYERSIKHLETAIYELVTESDAYWYLCLAYCRKEKWKLIEKYINKLPSKNDLLELVYEISLVKRGKQKKVTPTVENNFINEYHYYGQVCELINAINKNGDSDGLYIIKFATEVFDHFTEVLYKIAYCFYQNEKLSIAYTLYKYAYETKPGVENIIGMVRCLVWDKNKKEEFEFLKNLLYKTENRKVKEINQILTYHVLEDANYVSGTTYTILLNEDSDFPNFIKNYSYYIINENRIAHETIQFFFEENNYPSHYLEVSKLIERIFNEQVTYEEALTEIDKIENIYVEKMYLRFFTEVILKHVKTIDECFDILIDCCIKEVDFAILYHLCYPLIGLREETILIDLWKEKYPQSVLLKNKCSQLYVYEYIDKPGFEQKSTVLIDSILNSNLPAVAEFNKVFTCDLLYLYFHRKQFQEGLDHIQQLSNYVRGSDDVQLYEALFLYELGESEACIKILSEIVLVNVNNRIIISTVYKLDICPPRLREQVLNYEMFKIYRFYNAKDIPSLLTDIADSDKYLFFYRIGRLTKIMESDKTPLAIKDKFYDVQKKLSGWMDINFLSQSFFENEEEFRACLIANLYLGDPFIILIMRETLDRHFKFATHFRHTQNFYYAVMLDQLNVSGVTYSHSIKENLLEIEADLKSSSNLEKYYYAKLLTLLNMPKDALHFLIKETEDTDYIRYLKIEIYDLLTEKELLTPEEAHYFSFQLLPVKFSLLQSKDDVIYRFLKNGAIITARKEPGAFLEDIQPLLFILEMSETFSKYLSPNIEFNDEFINCIEFEDNKGTATGIRFPESYFRTVELLFPDKWSNDYFSKYQNMATEDTGSFLKRFQSDIEKEARGCLHAYQNRKKLEYLDFNGHLDTIIQINHQVLVDKEELLNHYLYLLYCVLTVSDKNPVDYYQRFVLHSSKAVLDQVVSAMFDTVLFTSSYPVLQLIMDLIKKNKDDVLCYDEFIEMLEIEKSRNAS